MAMASIGRKRENYFAYSFQIFLAAISHFFKTFPLKNPSPIPPMDGKLFSLGERGLG